MTEDRRDSRIGVGKLRDHQEGHPVRQRSEGGRVPPVNIGEEICGEWLRHICRCEFVQYNLTTPDVQGEIDVIGINLLDRTIYACEVAVHLVTGLQYVKANRPDNVPRLTAKFRKDVEYIRKAFPDYKHVFMLWSPVVKNQKTGSKDNQLDAVHQIIDTIKTEFGLLIEPVVNEKFQSALGALRAAARSETKELDCSVMRFLQVEEYLAGHVKRRQQGNPKLPDEGPVG